LAEDVPGLACKPLSIAGNAFFECCHGDNPLVCFPTECRLQ
jgi:hypothetical protein